MNDSAIAEYYQEKFIKRSYLTVRYRTVDYDKEETDSGQKNEFQYMYKLFELKNFGDDSVPKAIQVSTGFNDDFKDTDMYPIATFVYNKKYFFVTLKK